MRARRDRRARARRPRRAASSEPLHATYLRATGAQRSEKCGFSASARRNHAARRGAVAEAALDHPAVEELERVLRAEPERALRVARAPRRTGRCARAPSRARRRRRSTAARAGRSARARARAASRMPWSTSKSAISRSTRTPFARSSLSIAPISAYWRCAQHGPAGRPRRGRRARRRTAAAGSGRPPCRSSAIAARRCPSAACAGASASSP